jgi:7,8-dihydropterin-6-yl-methyl-4-(beta-D-ribofuranosyl)aminobenzene 5'-phosphate synthase
MAALAPADQVEVQILVDNATDNLSSAPPFVENEWAGLGRRRRGNWVMGGTAVAGAAHGLSCLVKITTGGTTRSVLFDVGPEDGVFERNVSRLGADLGSVEAIVLSHGHWDHAGAMLRALQIIRDRNGGADVPCYAHPDMFRTRGSKLPDGSMRVMEDVPGVAAMTANGGKVILDKEPALLAGGTAYVSGEIPRKTTFEKGSIGQHHRTPAGWVLDEVMFDERFLAVNVAGKGVVVLTACSHAGVVNVLHHAAECFPGVRLYAVMGGLHLSGANERVIPDTVSALGGFDLAVVAAGHCTGWRAMSALADAFGDRKLVPLSVGKRFIFEKA